MMTDKIFLNWDSLWGGGEMLFLTMLMKHCKITCQVDQVQSPISRFFKEKTSFWLDSFVGSSGQNTLSSACNKVH